MMGSAEMQKNMFHTVQLEDLVPPDHPLRRIRSLIGIERIRRLTCDMAFRCGRTNAIMSVIETILGGHGPCEDSNRTS